MELFYSGIVTECAGIVLEFFTVKTRPLFDVFSKGYIEKVENKAHW